MKPKISFSVADVPLGISLDDLFALAKELKVDGVEIVLGLKTLFGIKTLEKLSVKYNVKILSFHEPIFTGFLFGKEKTFEIASFFNAKYNIHSYYNKPIDSIANLEKFDKLRKMKDKYNLDVLLENMPIYFRYPFLPWGKSDPSTRNLLELKKICNKYDFNMTLDTTHLEEVLPQNAENFEEAFTIIKNIHLSDFRIDDEHLPLGKGLLNSKGFFAYLRREKYEGLITLEISPKIYYPKNLYFNYIKSSITIIQSLLKST